MADIFVKPVDVAQEVAMDASTPQDPASQTPEKPRRGNNKRVKKPSAKPSDNKSEVSPSPPKPRRRKAKIAEVKTTDATEIEASVTEQNKAVKCEISSEIKKTGDEKTEVKPTETLKKKKRFSSFKKADKPTAEKLTVEKLATEVLTVAPSAATEIAEVVEKVRPRKRTGNKIGKKGELPENRRLFGMFECVKCAHCWSSANVWKGKKQACILCKIMLLPTELRPLFHRRRRDSVGATVGGQPQEGQLQEGQLQDGQLKEGQLQEGQLQDGQLQDNEPQDGQSTEDVQTVDFNTKEQESALPRPPHPTDLCEMCQSLGHSCRLLHKKENDEMREKEIKKESEKEETPEKRNEVISETNQSDVKVESDQM